MNFPSENPTDIFDRYISGFRQYTLGETAALRFISQNFCDMTGYTKEELTKGGCSPVSLIHPGDRTAYDEFFRRLCSVKESNSAEYRLVKKDGSVIWVRDTVTVESNGGETAIAHSVLTDITDIKAESDDLHILNETVPCGMLKYTCERNPRVTYANQTMLDMVRIPTAKDGEMDYFELYRDNIFLMIPMEERRKFAHFLQQVSTLGTTIAGEITVLRCDGTRARLYGWVTKVKNRDGVDEYQTVCMDVTERYHARKASAIEQYLAALSDVYDKIFEYDFANQTVKYVSGGSDTFNRIRNLPMHMEEATEQWIEHSVCEEDRARVHEFFRSIFAHRIPETADRPPQIEYRSVTRSGEVKKRVGTFLKIDGSTSLYCTQYRIDEQEIDELKHENLELKKNMQEFVMRFSEGVMAFKVENDRVIPLYASDNVCHFFGYTKEDWLAMAENGLPTKDFIAQSTLAYEDVQLLFATGEAEFTYYDMTQNRKRLIKAICSHRNPDEHTTFYVMLYNLDNGETFAAGASNETANVYIRTFGYFDVFIGDKPIAFRNKKAKELLALLVDRRGGYVTSEEAIGYLWENEPVSAVTLARYRKEALRLKNTLEEYGIADIVESVDGKRRVVPERMGCDLYDYLSGREEYAGLFKGSYLTNYTWGEITLGELMNDMTS